MKKFILSAAIISLSTILLSQSEAPVDSLAGFDFIGSANHAKHAKTDQAKNDIMRRAKRSYIDGKYNLYNQNQQERCWYLANRNINPKKFGKPFSISVC